jgi:hypothetical protein
MAKNMGPNAKSLSSPADFDTSSRAIQRPIAKQTTAANHIQNTSGESTVAPEKEYSSTNSFYGHTPGESSAVVRGTLSATEKIL